MTEGRGGVAVSSMYHKSEDLGSIPGRALSPISSFTFST